MNATHTCTINPTPATANSLAGFRADCGCGWTICYSSRIMTEDAVREHYDWHANRGVFAPKRSRRARG